MADILCLSASGSDSRSANMLLSIIDPLISHRRGFCEKLRKKKPQWRQNPNTVGKEEEEDEGIYRSHHQFPLNLKLFRASAFDQNASFRLCVFVFAPFCFFFFFFFFFFVFVFYVFLSKRLRVPGYIFFY